MELRLKGATIAGAALMGALLMSGAAQAGITGYANNPQTNREDWQAAVGSFVTNIDFDAANNGASYTATSGGVASGFLGDGNNGDPTLNVGEGQHPDSNYYQVPSPGGDSQTFTVSFDSLVSGAGLELIDFFGADCCTNIVTLSAYSGVGGTGSLLGTVNAFNQNYQNNNVYFIGLTSDALDIGSIVLTRVADTSGDTLGIDNIVSSSGRVGAAVPEPASWALMISGFAGVGAMLRRRSALAAVA